MEIGCSVAVVVVDAEVPSVVGEDDGAMEVTVANQSVPHGDAEEVAEGYVAGIAHQHVVVVIVTQRYVVKVMVHAIYVVVVDAVNLIDEEWVANAEGVCHAVGQETCVAAYCRDAHALSVDCQCSAQDNNCCQKVS